MSAMEIVERSMSLMAEEHESEDKMAQDSILQQLYDRISSHPISELLGKLKLDEGLLNTLKTNLQSVDAILDDAESKAYEDEAVKRWLDDLNEVVYDLEDLLAEIDTERLHHQLESKRWNIETWLKIRFNASIPSRLEEISRRITLLLQRCKEEFGLSEASRLIREPYPLSAGKDRIEDECQVCGRDEDINAIIELLLSDNQTDYPVTVIPIVGVDGVGKTTLARFVYNDCRVTKHFDLKGWASVSDLDLEGWASVPDHFSLYGCLTKAFSEAFSTEDSRTNIEAKLNEILNMKKFLLILDDVPDMGSWVWDEIRNYCFGGAQGKILLTTQFFLRMSTPKWVLRLPDYTLKSLNSDGSWMLFVKRAFAEEGIGLNPGLEAIGKNIVAKCDGLPLLIVTLGAMLRFKPSVEEWEAVLRKISDLDTDNDMIPILQMSYDSLPPNLKRCFAYCKLFPKNHEYDKEKLVRLWMAEDFLQHSNHRRIEEVGHMYFDDLTFRSFFQKTDENSSRFVMHRLMHELVQFVSRDFCFRWDQYSSGFQLEKVRHLSYYRFLDFNESHPRLARTLLPYYLPPEFLKFSVVQSFVFESMQMIRVLSLSYNDITKLPDSFGNLKLLRYLDVSHTKITRLPDFVTTLYNLQTLLLSYCRSLAKLPTNLMKLVYLRHLDTRETCLEEMPAKLGSLTSLQSLSDFVVSKSFGRSNIRELGPLKNLRGTLCISQLQNVTSASDASEANLKDKPDLQELELKWRNAKTASQRVTDVLEKLEPHDNLEKLSIISYNGISFPVWVGDSSFSKMVYLRLSDCNSCSHLPPLGQLPSLKELIIEGMSGVKIIGPEFFSVNNVSAKPFPLLEILVFREMPQWEGWVASEQQPVKFSCLKRMCIESCPKYENHPSLCLPPSAKLEISVCEKNSMFPTEETLPEQLFTVEKQLHEGDQVQARGKEKLQDRPSTAGLLEVEELQFPDSILLQRTDVSITSDRPRPGSLQRLTEDEKRKNMSTMEIVKGSMSWMAEENKLKEKMAQDSILQQLSDRISSYPISELLGTLKPHEDFLNTVKTNLLRLDAILDDAESKAYEDEKVKEWLGNLKAVGYDLEDLLDEIASKKVRHQLEFKGWNIKTWVQRIISPKIQHRLEGINSRITILLKRGEGVLCLSEASRILRKPYALSAAKAHVEEECHVYGRDEDKEAIIKRLLSDHLIDDKITLLPIKGKGGVGKTTLAQLVYNDYRVCKHFDLKMWAHVPHLPYRTTDDNCLIRALSKDFNIEDSRNIGDKLNEILYMKKFLLVLDGLLEVLDLNRIFYYLLAGARGSKILLTTEFWGGRTARLHPAYHLKPLKSYDSWILFAKHAFADKETGLLDPRLESIGKHIVRKCNGLPLVIATLGAMLQFMPSAEEWEATLRKLSDLHTEKDIISILLMCYNSLPPNLKRCFAYCSIFPNDHEYDKEKLVLLWMAEGFLQLSEHRRIEEVGHEYFDDLTSRSFFQKSVKNSSRFVMHSLMHKLAQLVSGELCHNCDNSMVGLRPDRVRHLSWSARPYAIFTGHNISQLRTLLLYYQPPVVRSILLSELFYIGANKWKYLRVLSLPGDTITQLPNSIGELELLRYLDLSHTKITKLPDLVTTLYNLQTLLLSYCHLLSKLPEEFRKLVSLRHLDIRETCLNRMPAKMGCLTSLQNLSDFVVGRYSSSNIGELGPLSNLRGTLRISKLQNVVSARDAYEANLKNKADLRVLELKWSDARGNSRHATKVLEKLEPHQNLERLSIISYNGISFPYWVGNPSFSKMAFLRLSDCNSCSHLPPLGQLPSLKELIIEGMRRIKTIGPEFFGVNGVLAKPFPSLEILVFQEMPDWEGWIASEMQPVEFPCLKKMYIKSCPKYENHLSLSLPPAAEVEISASDGEIAQLPSGHKNYVPTTSYSFPPQFSNEEQVHEGDKVQLQGKEKLQDRPSTAGLPEVEELQLPDSNVVQRTDVSMTSYSPPPESPKRWTEDSSAKHGSASENSSAAAEIPSDNDTDDPINDDSNMVQFRRNEKLLDRPSTSRPPEELQLPDSNVVQRTDVSITSNSLPQESPDRLTEDSSAKHEWASNSEEDISSPEKESLNANNGDLAAIEASSDTGYSEDSQEDISSPEQECMNVSQFTQLESLPPNLYSLEIEACNALESLPADLNMLNNLQHLYITHCRLLKSIQASHLPEALKTLYVRNCKEVEFLSTAETYKFLESLCIESSCDSLESFPLAIFPQLRSLSIWDCTNFNSLSITKDHMFLDALEIRDCAQFISFPDEELRIPNLTSMLLSNCKNLKVLPGQLHGLTSLQSLFINECPEAESVPEGGLPSSLNLVCISFCHKLTPCSEWGLDKLNDFSRIEIEDVSKDLESFPEQNLLPRNLISLRISRLSNLEVLDSKGLQHLTSLETLKINSCNKLHSLPEEGLPSPVSYLYISDCPLLNSKLQNRRGKEWFKIAHIPHIQIDGKVIS